MNLRLKEGDEALAQSKGGTGGGPPGGGIRGGDLLFTRGAGVFGRQFSRLSIAMEIHSTETIKQAVVAGFGIAFLSAHTIGLDLLAGNLVVLDVQGFPALLNWYLVHNRSKRLPPVAAAFKEFLMRRGAPLIESLVHFELSGPQPRSRPPAAPQRPPRGRRARPRRAS